MNKRLLLTALFSVIGFLIMFFMEIPVIPMFPWLKLDLSETSALLIGFKFGPLYGIQCAIIRNILFFFFKDGGGIAGFIASSIASIVYIYFSTCFYRKNRKLKTAVWSISLATLLMAISMIPVNFYLLKFIYRIPGINMIKYILYGVVPFNIIKGILNGIITFFTYKKIGKVLFR